MGHTVGHQALQASGGEDPSAVVGPCGGEKDPKKDIGAKISLYSGWRMERTSMCLDLCKQLFDS